MNCPTCSSASRVVKSRRLNDGTTLRHRCCPCGVRWSTKEQFIAFVRSGDPQTTTDQPSTNGHEGPLMAKDWLLMASGKEKGLPPVSPPHTPPLPAPLPKRNSVLRTAVSGQREADVMGWFRSRWQQVYATSWIPEAGVRKNVAALVAALEASGNTEAELAAIPSAIDRYLADRDGYLVASRHPLRLFLRDVNKYRASAPTTTTQYRRLV